MYARPYGLVGKSREVAFTVKNHSKRHWRFEWPEGEGSDFSFAPRVGHLHAGASKTIVLTFAPSAAAAHAPAELSMSIVPIAYTAAAAEEGEKAEEAGGSLRTSTRPTSNPLLLLRGLRVSV